MYIYLSVYLANFLSIYLSIYLANFLNFPTPKKFSKPRGRLGMLPLLAWQGPGLLPRGHGEGGGG